MKRILRLRQEIDEIDEAILQLLKKRIDVSKRIGKTKKILHLPLRDHDREDEIFLKINETASQIGLPPQTRTQQEIPKKLLRRLSPWSSKKG